MGAVEDYINGLEGKENLDPLAIARDIHGLHTQEVSTREAKIEELTGSIAERDAKIAERDTDIQKWKAKNFDLAMQVPDTSSKKAHRPDDGKPGGDAIKVADLFSDDVRKRHFNG